MGQAVAEDPNTYRTASATSSGRRNRECSAGSSVSEAPAATSPGLTTLTFTPLSRRSWNSARPNPRSPCLDAT